MRIRAAVAAILLGVMHPVACADEPSSPRRPVAPKQADARPNVLIFVADDQRSGTLSKMRHVQRRFVKRGTNYTYAFDTTPLCCPSRASIFTGQYAHNHGVTNNSREEVLGLDQQTTLQYNLDRAGYHTAIFGRYFNFWPIRRDPPSFDRWSILGKKYYRAKFNVQGRIKEIRRHSTGFITDSAVRFLRRRAASDDPWFTYIAPYSVHAPFTSQPKYREAQVPPWAGNPAVGENVDDKPPWVREDPVSSRQSAKVRKKQLRALLSIDDMVKRVFRTLRQTGQAKNTIAFYMSDNGFLWGEHHQIGKRFPYIRSMQLPMAARWPGHIDAGTRDGRLAANIDVAPTIYEAVGIDPGHTVDGRSLLLGWDRDRLLVEYKRDFGRFDRVPTWAATLTRGYEYVEHFGDDGEMMSREYYDLIDDPWQLDNLLGDGDPTNDPPSPTLQALSVVLSRDRECAGSSCP